MLLAGRKYLDRSHAPQGRHHPGMHPHVLRAASHTIPLVTEKLDHGFASQRWLPAPITQDAVLRGKAHHKRDMRSVLVSCVGHAPQSHCPACTSTAHASKTVHVLYFCHTRSISGLVVEYIVAIDVTRVRFSADAFRKIDTRQDN